MGRIGFAIVQDRGRGKHLEELDVLGEFVVDILNWFVRDDLGLVVNAFQALAQEVPRQACRKEDERNQRSQQKKQITPAHRDSPMNQLPCSLVT